ncbi:MAG: hypothetical protein M1387_00510 [Thaumarchaeota archaeon]|nr:hypothetical protein [Nitrososphaerota archaeon]
MQQRIKVAITALVNAEDPCTLGELKHGNLDDNWAYEIGRSCRLLYIPISDRNTILLRRVCSHNEVYGN